MNLLASIKSYSISVSRSLKDSQTLQQARELVPIAELVQNNLEVLEGDYLNNILPLLVDWFKNDFYSWFSPPKCEYCNQDYNFVCDHTNAEGLSVEVYKCPSDDCTSESFEFIRHVDPAILLVTRTGRCGEWANCFLTFLKALEYDARLILDTSDHVWNEVWSEKEQKWIHVDPCENAIDTPLMYEIGWSKELSYCIALGENYALDVTPRYTSNYGKLISRRTVCDEATLARFLDELTASFLKDLKPEQRKIILHRREKDRVYLEELKLKPTTNHDRTQFQGRKTGSIAWRIERGEYNPIMNESVVIDVEHGAVPSDKTENLPTFSLQFNSYKNFYQSNVLKYSKKVWSSLTFRCENIDYKFERDWKTAYLARYEDCPVNLVGKVIWRFNLSKVKDWNKIELTMKGKVYSDTKITLTLRTYNNTTEEPLETIPLRLDYVNTTNSNQVSSDTTLIDIIAELSGGDETSDTAAWQKPQLFRQARDESTEWPFEFKLF